MSEHQANPIEENNVWPPAPTTFAIIPQPTTPTLLERVFSRLVGFCISLACQPAWFFLTPIRKAHQSVFGGWQDARSDPVHYWMGLSIVVAMGTVGVFWSLWDIGRTWQRMKQFGKTTDSVKFVLGFVAVLLNCGAVVMYHGQWTMEIE